MKQIFTLSDSYVCTTNCKKTFVIFIAVLFCLVKPEFSFTQTTTLYNQGFGTGTTFPITWTNTGTNGWSVVNNTNSTGYTGASGASNVSLTNTSTGTKTLTFNNNPLSTVGYSTISVIWGARKTSASFPSVTFQWSIDGFTWNTAAFTDVVANSTWALVNGGTAIVLPSGAENQANLRLRWSVTVGTTGTLNYRFDDLQVTALALPTISSFSPTSACQNSGQTVTITGTNFTGATAVKFNGISASFVINSSTSISAFLPSTATTGKISVTTAAGTVTSSQTFTVNSSMSGIYSVGSSNVTGEAGHFTTLTAAVAAYNTACLNGSVTFVLTNTNYSSSETFPVTINNVGASSSNTLTIKPNTGVTSTISGSNSSAILELNGADYVTIDGSNSGSTSRDLTIQNTSTSFLTSTVVWIASSSSSDGAANNTIKNCIITGASTTTSWAGITGSANTSVSTQAASPNSNNTIQNCLLSNAVNGIYIYGASSMDQNWSLTNNTVNSGYSAGILIQYANAFSIAGNNVSGINANALINGNTSGIEVTGNATNFTISNNTVSGVINSGATITTGGTAGILIGNNSVAATISGNTISAISNTGGVIATNTDGIKITGSSQSITITGNTISGVSASANASPAMGIEFSGAASGTNTVAYNKISSITQLGNSLFGSGYGAEGIYLNTSGSPTISVYNNFVLNVSGTGSSSAGYNNNGYGIMIDGGSGYKIYYNTVNLITNQSRSSITAAINISSTVTAAGAIDLRDNIFVNSQISGASSTQRYSIYSGAVKTVFSNIDYNDYWTTGSNLGFIGSNRPLLTDIQSGFGSNTHSKNIKPIFVSTSDLHLDVSNNNTLDNLGTPITGITDDIDADTRNATTPDMGADEFTSCSSTAYIWIGGTDNNWQTPSNWCSNGVPTTTSNVSIPSGTTYSPVISTADAFAASVTIAKNAALTMAAGFNLTLTSAGSFTNRGGFDATASTGAVIFQGSNTINGSSTTTFTNITSNGSIAFSTAPVINGIFTINSGAISGNAPTYGSSSTLTYNITGSYTAGFEWTTGSASTISTGAGIPQNVIINSGTVTIPNSGGTNRALAGDLTISSGAIFQMTTGSRDLYILGNWMNNGGTFNANGRTVDFNLTSATSATQKISGTTTFYDLTFGNSNITTDFGSSNITVTDQFNNDAGKMVDGTSTVILTGGTGSIIGGAAKNFYSLQINSGAVIMHNTGGGNIHVANSFVNNGSLTENNSYTFFFDSSGVTETFSGTGPSSFGKLTIGDVSGFGNPTTLNCSANFSVNGGSLTFFHNSVYNGNNNMATFSTTSATISGSGTAGFYNAATSVMLNPGSGIATINNSLTINTNGSIITNAPLYESAATLIYNTTTPTVNTGIEWTGNSGSTGAGSPYNVTVQNSNSVLINGSRTVPGTLNIATGNSLDINNNTLTVNTGFSGNGNLKGSATSGLITSGTGTVYFASASPYNQLKLLTVNSGGNLTLGGSIASGDTLNIVAGDSTNGYGTVQVSGTLNGNNLLTLKSDANGTAMVAPSTGIINDTVTVERYFPALRAWRFVAIPFSSTNQTINSAWQEGWVNSVLQCPSQYTGTPGSGTEISGGSSANGFDINNTGYASIKVYQNNGWIVPASTTTSNLVTSSSNNAYGLFVRGDRSVCLTTTSTPDVTTLRARGILNQRSNGGDMKVDFSGATPGDFIFIGNPYAAPLDIQAAVALSARNSGISLDKFWVWNPTLGGLLGVGGYVTFSGGLQVPFDLPLHDTTNYAANTVLQSGEAFMVQASSATGFVTFKENDKSSVERTKGVFGLQASPKQNQSSFTQASLKQRNPYTPPALYVNLLDQNNAIMDGIGVGFGNKYSPYIDSIDTQKKWNEEIENMAIVHHDTTLSIEFRPVPKQSDTVMLRLYLRQHPYTLQIFTRGVREDLPAEGWLVDKYLGTQTPLDIYHVNLYSFTPNFADTNSYRNRFMIVFNRTGKKQQQENKGIKTSANAVAAGNLVNGGGVSIYPNPVTGGKAMLNFNNMPAGSYELIVYNATGERLSESNLEHTGGNTAYPLQVKSSWGSGIYSVRIVNTTSGNMKNITFIINR